MQPERLWSMIRTRALLFALLVLVTGCGDCIKASDFFDIQLPDMGADLSTDTNEPPDDQGNTDTGRNPKDFGTLFDFGTPDQSTAPFELQTIIPNSGPVSGGTLVRIVGTGLSDGSTIYFGQNPVEGQLSSGDLVVRTPPSPGPGIVPVKVLAPDGAIRVLATGYDYVDDLSIYQVSPTRVPTSGGTEIEIQGSGFSKPAAVSFSGDPALRVEVISPTLIRALAPPRARGLADVRVTTVSETAEKPNAIDYFEPLKIISVSPSSGLVAGGELVDIKLEGLLETPSAVRFGDWVAPISNMNLQQGILQVIAPSNSAGLKDVFVETVQDAAVLPDSYLYRADNTPVLAAIRPVLGPESGGIDVTLVGYGFNQTGAEIQFDGQPATWVTQTADRGVVKTPAGTGVVDVTFWIGGIQVSSLSAAYSFVPDLSLSSLSPASGPTSGGEALTLIGSGLSGITQVFVGGIPAAFVVVSDTEVTVTTPMHTGGLVDVRVHRDGLVSNLEDSYTYDQALEIWGFTPIRGSVAGGTFIQVRGQGIFGELAVTVDGLPGTQVRRVDQNNLTFFTPSHAEGDAEISVSARGMAASADYPYSYYIPTSRYGGALGGPIDGAVNVTVFAVGAGPIPDAFVMLSNREDTPYQGFTDQNGMITLSGSDVLGAQTVTATAAGYSSTTIQTIDAEDITIFLNLLEPQGQPGAGPMPPRASVWGTIRATGKLADPENEKEYDLAMVQTTQRTPWASNPPPGSGGIVLGEGRYEITTRIGDMAVVGICGAYNEESQVFTPKLLALERYVFLNDQERANFDLVCDIPLESETAFKLVNTSFAPSGPNSNRVEVFWDLGFVGVIKSPMVGESLTDVVTVTNQPAATGVLEDLVFEAWGGSYTFAGGAPYSKSVKNGFAYTGQRIQMPTLLDVPEAIDPLPGGSADNGKIKFQASGPFYPDFYSVTVRNDMGIPVYQWILPGTTTEATIPNFPDFSSLPAEIRPNPTPRQVFYTTVTAARLKGGLVFDEFSYRALDNESWESWAIASWQLRLPGNQ